MQYGGEQLLSIQNDRVVIELTKCIQQIPKGDREAIAAGIQSLGGQWRNALTKEVTHLFALAPGGVCSSLPDPTRVLMTEQHPVFFVGKI